MNFYKKTMFLILLNYTQISFASEEITAADKENLKIFRSMINMSLEKTTITLERFNESLSYCNDLRNSLTPPAQIIATKWESNAQAKLEMRRALLLTRKENA